VSGGEVGAKGRAGAEFRKSSTKLDEVNPPTAAHPLLLATLLLMTCSLSFDQDTHSPATIWPMLLPSDNVCIFFALRRFSHNSCVVVDCGDNSLDRMLHRRIRRNLKNPTDFEQDTSRWLRLELLKAGIERNPGPMCSSCNGRF